MSTALRRMMQSYAGADMFMKQAVMKINEDPQRKVVVQVVPAFLPESHRFHPSISRWMNDAIVRIRVYTHADLVSDRALYSVLKEAQEQDPEMVVIVMDTREAEEIKPKSLSILRYIMIAAMIQTSTNHALVCGMPNAGKSSLILPLTKDLVMKTKKKKNYHLAKVSPLAGRTASIKTHRLSDKPSLFLKDSPGLLPNEINEMDLIDAVASGSLPASAKVTSKNYDVDAIVKRLLDGLNFHAKLSNEEPPYVKLLGLPSPISDISTFIRQFSKSDLNSLRNNNKTPVYATTESLIRVVRKGLLGRIVFVDEENQSKMLADLDPTKPAPNFQRRKKESLIYINPPAKEFYRLYTTQQATDKLANKDAKKRQRATGEDISKSQQADDDEDEEDHNNDDDDHRDDGKGDESADKASNNRIFGSSN